jgi:hypothetical protein
MKKSNFLLMAIALFFCLTQTHQASAVTLGIVVHKTPQKIVRFTVGKKYFATFQSVRPPKEINYKKLTDDLEKHFNEVTKRKITGLIKEDQFESSEEIVFHIYGKAFYQGIVKISKEFFSNNGEFKYNLAALRKTLEHTLNQEIKVLQIKEKGDERHLKVKKENGWVTI